MLKPLTIWITTNCGKFFKRWEYQTSLPASCETCTPVKRQQLEQDMEQWTGPKLGKEYIEAVYCHAAYLNYMQSSVPFSSVAHSCLTLCNTMNCSTPGLPVHHQLPEFTQTHVHRAGDPSSHLILCRPLLLLPQSLPASKSFPMSQLFA